MDKACDRIRQKLESDKNLQHHILSYKELHIILLLRFTLSNSYFTHKSVIYKHIHGCAMGSPVNPVVSNIFMEEIKEKALSETTKPPKTWKRFADDIFPIVKKNAVSTLHNELNLNETDRYLSLTR